MNPPFRRTTVLRSAQRDRAAGVLVGSACGDALGAPYEFQPARIHGETVVMEGGGSLGWEPGEWTDDTSMAIAIAEVCARGWDLRSEEAIDAITERFVQWAETAPDVGVQTRAVLSAVRRDPRGINAIAEARAQFERRGRSGNGSLMRTAPVALAYLDDPEGLAVAARSISSLTHAGDDAEEACVLWCSAIAHAVIHGTFDGLRIAVDALAPERAAIWHERLDIAEATPPHEIASNGWSVAALQAAWSAIVRTPVPESDPASGSSPAQHFGLALEAAVRVGDDTDTVAAIAGALLGARWGISAIPLTWRRHLHGWPGMRTRDLVRLSILITEAGQTDTDRWPLVPVVDYSDWAGIETHAVHPHDDGVLIGGVAAMRSATDVDAIVSLCRLGRDEVPRSGIAPEDHVEAWLVDDDSNQHAGFVLRDAAAVVAQLRAEGKRVLLHCVRAESRTPSVAIAYSMLLGHSAKEALRDISAVLPNARPNASFRDALGL